MQHINVFYIEIMNFKNKLEQVSRNDQRFLDLDNLLARKKRDIFFTEKNIIQKYIHRIRIAALKYGVISYVFIKFLVIFGLKSKNNKIPKPFNPLNEQPTIVLPLKQKKGSYHDMEISIFLHAYYVDEIDKVFSYLENMPTNYRLCITTDNDKKNQEITKILKAKGIAEYRIITCRNRGRDIAPMLIEFREEFDKCKYALHIHTKKSPHDSELRGWSDYLYQNLLGNINVVESILSIFKEHPSVGMIAPEHFYPISKSAHLDWGNNFNMCCEMLRNMGISIAPDSKLSFPSGSMFWFRVEAIKPLLNLNLQYEDFHEERGQVDGTLAHAIERIFFYSCEIAGFSWLNTVTAVIPPTHTNKIEGELFISHRPRLLPSLNNPAEASF